MCNSKRGYCDLDIEHKPRLFELFPNRHIHRLCTMTSSPFCTTKKVV